MFSDRDNPVTAAAAAPAHESQSPETQKEAASQTNPAEDPPAASQEQATPAFATPKQRFRARIPTPRLKCSALARKKMATSSSRTRKYCAAAPGKSSMTRTKTKLH